MEKMNQYEELYKTYSYELQYIIKKENEVLKNPMYVEIIKKLDDHKRLYDRTRILYGYDSPEFAEIKAEHEIIKKEAIEMEYKIGFTSLNFLFDYINSEAYKLYQEMENYKNGNTN